MKFTINVRTNLKKLMQTMGLKPEDEPDTLQLLVELVSDCEYYGCAMTTPIFDTPFEVTCEPLTAQQLMFAH